MKLIEFKNEFIKSTNINVFKDICIKLGIGVINGNDVDLNVELTEEQINELKLNTQINKHAINQWIIGKQKDIQNDYKDIIEYCENQINSTMLLDEDKETLENIKKSCESEKKRIDTIKNKMQGKNAKKDAYEIYLDYEKDAKELESIVSDFDQMRIDFKDDRISVVDKRIDKKVNDLNYAQALRDASSSKLMQKIQQNKMNKLNQKLKKLKSKKGLIQVKQRQIINKNVNKYYEKKNIELQKQKAKFEKEMNYAKEHYEYQSVVDALNSDIEMNNNIVYSNIFKKAASKVENMQLGAEKIKFQIKIAALKVKNGKIKIPEPVFSKAATRSA